MYQQFHWTDVAQERNRLLQKYEPVQPFVFFELARQFSPRYFFDVGANVGSYSILLSNLECVTNIYSFEPSPDTYKELQANIELNNLESRLKPIEAAVSDTSGLVAFIIINNYSGANGISSTILNDGRGMTCQVDVLRVVLDHEFNLERQSIALKIDVEGHELHVLRGAQNLLRNNRILLQIEILGLLPNETKELICGFGFSEIFRIGSDHYFTNDQTFLSGIDKSQIYEASLESMIYFMRNYGQDNVTRDPPIKLHLTSNLSVEISRVRARELRAVRNWFRRLATS